MAMLGNVLRVTNATVEAPGVQAGALADGLTGLTEQDLFRAVFFTGELRTWYRDLSGPLLIEADPDLQSIQWESMHDGDGFVAVDRGMARVIDTPDLSQTRDRESQELEVLVAMASPVLNTRLSLDHVEQPFVLNLEQAVETFRGVQGEDFAAHFRVARHVTRARLDEELAVRADVLHLLAHGNKGFVALEDRAWRSVPAKASELAREAVRAGARLVVLESCFGAALKDDGGPSTALTILEAGVPMVVGMTGSVSVEAARAFTRALYKSIARGIGTVDAVRLARRAMTDVSGSQSGVAPECILPCLYLSKRVIEDGEARVRPTTARQRHAGWKPALPATTHGDRTATEGGAVRVSGDVKPWPEPMMKPSQRFVGRRDKLSEIAKALDPDATDADKAYRILLTGHGGIGKTELALQAAERLRHRFQDGLVVVSGRTAAVELAEEPSGADKLLLVGSEQEFVAKVARALEVELSGDETDAELVSKTASAANQREILLVLDNLEPFAEGELVTALLRALGNRCRVLATSRHELPGADARVIDVAQLAPHDAQRMVLQEAKAQPTTVVQVARLAEACRFTPMAIRLAVGRIAAPGQTEDMVVTSFEEFTGHAEELIRYAFGETLTAAGDEARLVFACAAMFVQPARREALEAATGLDEDALSQGIEDAVRLSLLDDAGSRFELLPLARPVAEGELEKLKDAEERWTRAAEECAQFVRTMNDLMRPDRVAAALEEEMREEPDEAKAEIAQRALHLALGELEAEWESALALAERAFAAEEWRVVTGFGLALNGFLELRGMYAEALAVGKMARRAAQKSGDRRDEGATLNNMAIIHTRQGRYDDAMGMCQEGLEIMREIGDRRGEGAMFSSMAGIHDAQKRHEKAIGLHEKAADVFRDTGDERGLAATLGNMAEYYQREGQHDQAIQTCKESLKIHRELGDKNGEGATLGSMAGIASDRGQHDDAMRMCQEGLAIMREIGDRLGEGIALMNMGALMARNDEIGKARGYWQQALQVLEGMGVPEEEKVRGWLASSFAR